MRRTENITPLLFERRKPFIINYLFRCPELGDIQYSIIPHSVRLVWECERLEIVDESGKGSFFVNDE